ncbi:hypothetical protein JTE90_023909 [Oedothorax gibbosus]|uniref:Uncharacterized protein n=1 Tax=Oedothorax gibbosus TaxID=931172 RepID=A0AAV6UM12_9ARAC|nr:hypothetical protein JTE90_023909 [Oedothorax gibbosus]
MKNYIEVCVENNEIIPCFEDSWCLTEGKVMAIYDALKKEEKKKDPVSEDLRELLDSLKSEFREYSYVGLNEFFPETLTFENIVQCTKAAIFDYQYSKQEYKRRCYTLGKVLIALNDRYCKEKVFKDKRETWDEYIQKFFKENGLKMKSTCEKNLRRFSRDIDPYTKLLFTDKSYTELRRILPKIRQGLELFPMEKEFWCTDVQTCCAIQTP